MKLTPPAGVNPAPVAPPAAPLARPKSSLALPEPADAAASVAKPEAASAVAWLPLGLPTQAIAAPGDVAAPTVAAAAPLAPAAQQVAVVVGQLVSRAGAHRMVLQLQPENLGRIEVSIERTAAGATHVALTADRPETLRTLLRDHAEIARALDRAGVPADQRTVTVAAATPAMTPPVTRPEPTHDAAQTFGAQSFGQAFGQAPGQGQPNQPQDRGRQHAAFAAGSLAALDDDPAGRWLRRGFDITA